MSPREFPEYLSDVSETGEIHAGAPLPLGAHREDDGVNFAIFSRHATSVRLEFYDHPDDAEPARALELDPVYNRTGDVWHIWVQGVRPGQLYGYRIAGPYQPEEGHRFNPHKLLLDPLAEAVTYHGDWDFSAALGYDPGDEAEDLSYSERDNAGAMPKSIFTSERFDWEGDEPLKRPLAGAIIYETHVRGLTIHDSSGVDHPGSYQGLIEKIPYLKELGVTAVELMPVQEFNEDEINRVNPETGEPLKNYWGYNPVAFLAPESFYCSRGTVGHQVLEFKEMVKALHKAGIEVIVDIVLNHTAEGNRLGPTISLRGVDNAIYYMLDENPRFYQDYTGTGNTIKADHPVVRDFILDVLRHWVIHMHVDGFRFDLASVLGRDEEGEMLADPPLLERIAEDPILREAKLIAEAWDTGGAYQVGSFAEHRWAEWNGRYRDDVRRFWRGDAGMVGDFAGRIAGSADLYERPEGMAGKGPERSINYITSHDGFTLNDLVSYEHKHNEANGEDNQDGTDANYSANYGVEGPTDDQEIQAVRCRQIKNLLLTLFISRGVPMLLGGDEFRRTQQGNNNAYCQDNEISWYLWDNLETHGDIHRFVQGMIRFRQAHPVLCKAAFYTSEDIRWCDPAGETPAWDDPDERRLACLILGDASGEEEKEEKEEEEEREEREEREEEEEAADLYLIFNAAAEAATFTLPDPPDGCCWRLVVDTGASTPDDFVDIDEARELDDPSRYNIGPRASAILIAAT